MTQLNDYFTLKVSEDHMNAELHYTDDYLINRDIELTTDSLIDFLKENNIVFGLDNEAINRFVSGIALSDFPVVVARGEPPQGGKDGEIHYEINLNPVIEKTDSWNFRDVMLIPSVTKDQKLATITLPTQGVEGTTIHGNIAPAKPGKPLKMKTGKNVRFVEEDLSFYADSDGQASVQGYYLHVHAVYELFDTLSMKEGNLDFIGTIIIKGDVPSGYSLKAGGDIKIFGMVEAATIKAEGSIYISEGLSGLQKGFIEAGENIQIGYINQGNAKAGNNLYVENSILHSECTTGNELICQRGSIIGGYISAGESIQVRHVGNQMSTKTELILGQNHKEVQKLQDLKQKKKEIEDTLSKLSIIGKKLSQTPNIESNPKLFVALQRQKASFEKNNELLSDINEQLTSMSIQSSEKHAKLMVTGNLYANTMVTFGKYKRVIDTSYKQVELELVNKEIFMRTL